MNLLLKKNIQWICIHPTALHKKEGKFTLSRRASNKYAMLPILALAQRACTHHTRPVNDKLRYKIPKPTDFLPVAFIDDYHADISDNSSEMKTSAGAKQKRYVCTRSLYSCDASGRERTGEQERNTKERQY